MMCYLEYNLYFSTGTTIGIAWMNMLCQRTSFAQTNNGVTQYVSGAAVSTVNANEWMTIARNSFHLLFSCLLSF